MNYTAHDVTTSDGATLKAWYFPARTSNSTKVVLISHSGKGNMADYLRRVDQFLRIGYNVVTYDYRGFGESSEFEIDDEMYTYPHFIEDTKAMIQFVTENYSKAFDLYGWGIGAGLSIGVGYHSKHINKIIADTPFTSLSQLSKKGVKVPKSGYAKTHEPLYALDEKPTSSKKNTKKIKLIIGSNDDLVTMEDLKSLQSKQKKVVNKSIFVVNNPDKKDNFRVDKSSYFKVIKEFLEE